MGNVFRKRSNIKTVNTDNETIPNTIHLIWVGNKIPTIFLKTVARIWKYSRQAHYQVILWKDNPYKILHECLKYSESLYFLFTNYLTLKNINSIIEDFSATKDLSKELICEIHKALNLELSGNFHNYAAASDILRYMILYIYGGVYMDLDLVPNVQFQHPETFRQTYKKNNFMVWVGGNALIMSAKGNQILKLCIRIIATNYYYTNPKIMDQKRSSYNKIISPKSLRLKHTVAMTGPEVILNSIILATKTPEERKGYYLLYDTNIFWQHEVMIDFITEEIKLHPIGSEIEWCPYICAFGECMMFIYHPNHWSLTANRGKSSIMEDLA